MREKYHNVLTERAKQDIEKLKQGEHVDYLIGFVNFLDCKIDLSFRPLIPRPETEYWVKDAMQRMKKRYANAIKEKRYPPRRTLRCLDIFAGSGCVGVAVLKNVPFACVDFADNDSRCLAQIQKNLTINGIDKKRWHVIQSDIFSNISGAYDYILANPPYLATSRKENVQRSVLHNEPANALFAGGDGLDTIRTFLAQAKHHLTKQGIIYLEFDSFQKAKIATILQNEQYSEYKFFKDQFDNWRYVIAK